MSVRLSQRLLDISRRERLKTDSAALTALCEKTGNDIRSCLATLQFYKSRGKALRAADVARANLGQKDSQKSLFAVWDQIFEVTKEVKIFCFQRFFSLPLIKLSVYTRVSFPL